MKKWVYLFITILFVILTLIGIFNYIIDPLWTFSHKNRLQSHQEGFDERQQKLNLIYFNNFNYDGVLLGSSRVTLHDVNTFKDKNIFNLAVDGMRPYEYNSFIEYAKKRNKKDFEYIILGLDFIAINDFVKNYSIKSKINITEGSFYRYKTLFSYDNTLKSIRNIKNIKKYKKRFKTYNQNYVASSFVANGKVVEEKVFNYIKNTKDKEIEYKREEYINTLKEIIKNNPNSKIIIFSTPLPSPLIKSIFKNEKNRISYINWMKDLVSISAYFYSFFDVDNVSNDYKNTFMDSGHYYPFIGNCINQKIFDLECSSLPQYSDNFGFLIKEENVDEFIYKQFMKVDKIDE